MLLSQPIYFRHQHKACDLLQSDCWLAQLERSQTSRSSSTLTPCSSLGRRPDSTAAHACQTVLATLRGLFIPVAWHRDKSACGSGRNLEVDLIGAPASSSAISYCQLQCQGGSVRHLQGPGPISLGWLQCCKLSAVASLHVRVRASRARGGHVRLWADGRRKVLVPAFTQARAFSARHRSFPSCRPVLLRTFTMYGRDPDPCHAVPRVASRLQETQAECLTVAQVGLGTTPARLLAPLTSCPCLKTDASFWLLRTDHFALPRYRLIKQDEDRVQFTAPGSCLPMMLLYPRPVFSNAGLKVRQECP